MQSWRTTLLLAVLVLVAAIVVLRDKTADRDPGASLSLENPSPVAQPTTAGRLLLDFERDKIEAAILTSGEKRFDVRREHGRWQDPVSGRILDALLDDVGGLRTLDEVAANPTDLAEYGLQPPKGTLEFHVGGSAPTILRIGELNPSTTAVYVRFGDSGPVYLAGALTAWKFETAMKQLAARL